MDKTSFKIFIGALLGSILLFAGVFFLVLKFGNNEKIEVTPVVNPTMFFTVENCVNKYVSLLASEDSEAVYHLIDKKYRDENEITVYNALASNIHLTGGNYSFVAKAMMEDKNIPYRYYVKGLLIEQVFTESDYEGERREYGLIVQLDVSNYTYSIIPSEVGDYFGEI